MRRPTLQTTPARPVILTEVILCLLLCQVQADCNAPSKVDFAWMSPPGFQSVYSEGESITYTCQPGYLPLGHPTRECMDGQWTGSSFQCKVVVCGDPGVPDNGKRIGATFHFGSQVTFECNEGYSMIGRRTTFCQANQKWSNPMPTCKASSCPPVQAPDHGRVFPNNRATLGTEVRYICDDKYLWTGDKRRTCLSNSTWSGQDGACLASCGTLEVSDNVMYEPKNKTTAGAVVTFRCPVGFRMAGPSSITCTDEGKWSHESPTCRPISCGDPGSPGNGRRIGSVFTFGSLVSFRCDQGYVMRGRSSTFCQADQQWSNPVPYCKAVLCPPVSQPDHGSVFPSDSLTVGTVVRYSCEQGFTWTGSPSHECRHNGKWSGQAGTCQVVDCGVPKNLDENIIYEPQSPTNVGKVIHFSCAKAWAYSLVGSTIAECRGDGLWSEPTPRCMSSCTHEYIDHGRWQHDVAMTEHGLSDMFWCETKHYHTNPENGIVRCQDGVWNQKPNCIFKRPWWCWHKSWCT